jgi:methionyl aminopeptidase
MTDISKMRAAGRLAADTLDYITPYVVPGVTTGELDKLCHDFIVERGGVPSSLNYKGFPKSICTSVNHVVCHGIPGDKKLVEGDIVNLDVAATLDEHIGDTSRTFGVGKIGVKAQRLLDVTQKAMYMGIEQVKPDAHIGYIGLAIQTYVESQGFSVVRDYVGHGVNTVYHDQPQVPHFWFGNPGPKMVPGMTFTIEPMVNVGKPDVKLLQDGWTVVSRDRSLSAQFEHTVLVTATGFEILTLSQLP